MYKITGEVMWADVHVPNTRFEPIYSIDMDADDPVVEGAAIKLGLNIKTRKDGTRFVRIKRKVNQRSGKIAQPPTVTDAYGNPMTDAIGNGSVCTVHFNANEWSSSFGEGVAAYLLSVQVDTLVPFESEVTDLNTAA